MSKRFNIFLGLSLLTTLTHCSNQKANDVKVEFKGDSLKIITETKGDTIIKNFVELGNKINDTRSDTSIYFSKFCDTTISISSFFFDMNNFKIYFDRPKVINYCDSVIQNTPPDKENEGFVNWSIISSATYLKKFAQSTKPGEDILAGWNEELLDRFNPLIIDTITKQKAKRLLIEKFTNGFQGYTSYYAISNQGDTAMVGFKQDYLSIESEK